MSLSDCPSCWDTPCSCGDGYRHMSTEETITEINYARALKIGMNLLNEQHDPRIAYKEGDVPRNANMEWEYIALADVPANQNILCTDTQYWIKAFGTKDIENRK